MMTPTLALALSLLPLAARDAPESDGRYVVRYDSAEPIDPATFLVPLGLILVSVDTPSGPRPELQVSPDATPAARSRAADLLGL